MLNVFNRRRIRRKDRRMDRAEILATIARLRRGRDMMRRQSMEHSFARGMSAGYHLAAHVLWRDYDYCRTHEWE